MKTDYQINQITNDKGTIFKLDRIQSDKDKIIAKNLFTGTESECLRELAKLKEKK